MTKLTRRYWQWATVSLLAVAVAGCQKSDVVAPDGATISMTANPATIVLSGGIQSEPVTIVATVSNSIGVPLKGQDVRFTTTAGTLTPASGTPVGTDDFGNAVSVLTEARQSPTITARSGKATQPLQLQTANCQLSAITLSPGPLPLNTCNDTFDMTAVATDTNGAPCPALLINFVAAGTAPSTDVAATFSPPSKTTDTNGEATTTLTINSNDCSTKCVGKTCTGAFKATSGSVTSNTVQISDGIS